METKKAWDPWYFSMTIDYDLYCAIVSCGGDGTFHEIINGMLHREDKKRLPIGVLPNGSANDLGITLNLDNFEKSLNCLTKGDIVNIDILKAIIDYESEEDIPEEKHNSNLRYFFDCAYFGMLARISDGANMYKPRCGKSAYKLSAIK